MEAKEAEEVPSSGHVNVEEGRRERSPSGLEGGYLIVENMNAPAQVVVTLLQLLLSPHPTPPPGDGGDDGMASGELERGPDRVATKLSRYKLPPPPSH